jgi:hypothetical protein
MVDRPILFIGGGGKTGRRVNVRLQARDFSDYARATAAAGVWRA